MLPLHLEKLQQQSARSLRELNRVDLSPLLLREPSVRLKMHSDKLRVLQQQAKGLRPKVMHKQQLPP